MKNGYYWFTSERSLKPSVGQHIDGKWFLIGEEEPVTLEEINRRGWDLGKRVQGQGVSARHRG